MMRVTEHRAAQNPNRKDQAAASRRITLWLVIYTSECGGKILVLFDSVHKMFPVTAKGELTDET